MPSWITHFVTANQIEQDCEKNEFIFANIMPDILEGYNLKEVSKIVKDYQTHYPKKQIINGITISLPNIQKFKEPIKTHRNPHINYDIYIIEIKGKCNNNKQKQNCRLKQFCFLNLVLRC